MIDASELTTRFDFCVPEAQWLSDLTGVREDLVAVLRICNRAQADAPKFKLEPNADMGALMEARYLLADLLSAAIVRYMRTHGTGVRAGIPFQWVNELPPHLVTAHGYFKNLRDKMIAHSVNPLEDNQVFAWVKGYGTPQAQVTHVNASPGRYLSGSEDAQLLGRLSQALLSRVDQEIEAESARLLSLAQSLSVDEVCARGTNELPVPSPSHHAGRVRPPFDG